jgi:hypothetical protein
MGLDVEADFLIFGEGAEAVGFDAGVVDEDIGFTVFSGDEAVAFLVVEPFNFAGDIFFMGAIHFWSPSYG